VDAMTETDFVRLLRQFSQLGGFEASLNDREAILDLLLASIVQVRTDATIRDPNQGSEIVE
jgi:hypothetical protein